jgi:hypothetical protein
MFLINVVSTQKKVAEIGKKQKKLLDAMFSKGIHIIICNMGLKHVARQNVFVWSALNLKVNFNETEFILLVFSNLQPAKAFLHYTTTRETFFPWNVTLQSI